MKFYDFLDKGPAIGRLVVIEGTERVLTERALETIVESLLPPDVRELNSQRFNGQEAADAVRVREAMQAMPFLADRRVVIVADAQTLDAQERRNLAAVALEVPEGNTLIVTDVLSPRSKRPPAFATLLEGLALRVDTTATRDVRARFVRETLERLGARAGDRVVEALTESGAGLAAIRNDLEKLALSGSTIALQDLEREALAIEDPKTYLYASALLDGRVSEALAIAHECFASEPRGAAVPLLVALANECSYVWELARRGGSLPARMQWREDKLRPLARRVGARRAQLAYDRAVGGLEAIVTGRAGSDPGDYRALVERISVELSGLSRRGRR